MQRYKHGDNIRPFSSVGGAALGGTLAAPLTCLILLTVSAIFIFRTEDPLRAAFPAAAASLYVGCAAGGYVSSHRRSAHPITAALICTAAVTAVFAAALLIIRKQYAEPAPFPAFRLLSVPAAVMTGGLTGSIAKPSRNAKRTGRAGHRKHH